MNEKFEAVDDWDLLDEFEQAWIECQIALAESGQDVAQGWPFKEGPGFDLDPSTRHPGTSYVQIDCDDCVKGMQRMPADSVHAIVTDPPYGMGIDGQAWDGKVPGETIWREALRTLKPGGIAIAASHAHTYHHLASAMEAAGFDVVDMFIWRYSQSFPAGLVLDAKEGWKTHLRRAHEPWCVARKPFPVEEYVGKSGKIRKKELGNQETYDKYGTGGFWVLGNSLDGGKTASNMALIEKPQRPEKSIGLDPADIKKGTTQRGKKKKMGAGTTDQPNPHPTVKPLALMRRLVRLVAREGDMIMDPFAGSGTTGMAAMAEGMDFIGFEMDPEYYDLMQQRVAHAHSNRDSIPAAPEPTPLSAVKPKKTAAPKAKAKAKKK